MIKNSLNYINKIIQSDFVGIETDYCINMLNEWYGRKNNNGYF